MRRTLAAYVQTSLGRRSVDADAFPRDGGIAVKYGNAQIAVFNFAGRGEWYATQNMCPHKKAFVLSRGIVGDAGGRAQGRLPAAQEDVLAATPASVCRGEDYRIATFPVQVEGDDVYVELPPAESLDADCAAQRRTATH